MEEADAVVEEGLKAAVVVERITPVGPASPRNCAVDRIV